LGAELGRAGPQNLRGETAADATDGCVGLRGWGCGDSQAARQMKSSWAAVTRATVSTGAVIQLIRWLHAGSFKRLENFCDVINPAFA